jgi:integrase
VTAVEDGLHVTPDKLTLVEFVEGKNGQPGWLASLDAQVVGGSLRGATVVHYRYLMQTHVLPRIGGVRLAAIDGPMLNKMYADMLTSGKVKRTEESEVAGLSPTTVHATHIVIGRALKDAVRWGKVARNAAMNADPPATANSEKAIWTGEQLGQFLTFAKGDRLYAMWHLLATTGLRRGEVAGLSWADTDLEGAVLNIRRARVIVGNDVVDSVPKTEKGKRLIALDPTTVAVLRSHRARQGEERLAWGPAYVDTGLVFTKPDGSGLHPGGISSFFKNLVKRSGLPRITVHGVRHSYATHIADRGVSIEVVSKRLGHASVSITADLYRHRTDESDRAAAEAGAIRHATSGT